ncbi:MAG: DUF2169 domain-containing protein [Rhodospirillales bacterium]|nr:DUF2169 domain-containing protein [Rhodospirillales bacterium]
MRTLNHTPFPLVPRNTVVTPPALSLTFVLKGSFAIKPDAPCEIAKEQQPISGEKTFMDEIGRSLSWSTDLAPFKPHTDFFVFGHFHQPGGRPAPEGRASFELGPLHKELTFFGPRVATKFDDRTWQIGPAEPMTQVPLRWEFSFGGLADRRNPMGKGIDALPGTVPPAIALPQIEDPRAPLRQPGDRPIPANFAPMPSRFSARRRKLGTRDQRWQVFRAPLPPDDYDPSYHNAAPPDQQAGNYPRGDEKLILRNLHPTIAELVTYLPGLRPRLALLRQTDAGVVAEEVTLHLDTIVALPDEDQIVLLWRGVTPIRTRFIPDEVLMTECDMEALGPVSKLDDMPAKLLAKYLADQGASTKEDAEQDAQTLAEIHKLLAKADLPPAVMQAAQAEKDPVALYQLLSTHMDKVLAELSAKYSLPYPPP